MSAMLLHVVNPNTTAAMTARIAAAAKAAGKPWVMPCWTQPERAFAKAHDVSVTVVGAQFYMVRAAFASLVDGLSAEGLI